MKTFNINDYIYIQITKKGFEHLINTVGDEYIEVCIGREPYQKVINGQYWYRLQAHNVFSLLPMSAGGQLLYKTEIMIDDESLKLPKSA
jgi:hypothetical protein